MTRQDVLPLSCGISGVCLTLNVASPLSFHAGTLLMLVACLVWMKRLGHR